MHHRPQAPLYTVTTPKPQRTGIPAAAEAPQVSRILGVAISRIDLQGTMDTMCQWIEAGEKKRLCVTPVNCVLWARQQASLRHLYNSADLTLADGVPLLWASRFLGEPIPGRVTGLDLLPAFTRIAAERGYTFFFLGAREGVGATLAHVLSQQSPSLKIVGTYTPPFATTFSAQENAKMIAKINAVKPNVLWVSLTAPKQDLWIYEHFDQLDVNIAIGVGGAFEVTAGLISRAPLWMQRAGLEWLYRFSREPGRLFRRYFLEAPWFIPLVLRQKMCSPRRFTDSSRGEIC
jgi:N-acetylglucosaminyldiphosphoundecaprenol N-acetyl-beta-D-mannosaminyltransferase